MTGRILAIGNVESIPSKNGDKTFTKRTLVLNCTRSNFGEVYENYPSFEFAGRHIDDPVAFKVGDIVTVSFVVQGNKYKKDNQPEKFFNTIAGYKIEPYNRTVTNQSSSSQQTLQQTVTQQNTVQNNNNTVQNNDNTVQNDDDLPF